MILENNIWNFIEKQNKQTRIQYFLKINIKGSIKQYSTVFNPFLDPVKIIILQFDKNLKVKLDEIQGMPF